MCRIHQCSVFVCVACLASSFAISAPATAPSDQNESIVTRVYDISDLLWRKADYPAPALEQIVPRGGGGGGQAMFGGGQSMEQSASPGGREPADSLIKLLQDTVSSESWKDNGGSLGSLRELSGQLVVTQTPENQRRISDVLDELRGDRGRMVIVRAYWLMLEPENVPGIAPSAGGKELPVIDDKLIDAKHLYCAGQTMCFSGQTVHITSGRTRSIVTDLTPVVGTQAVGYNPQIERARSGVSLQVTPHLEPEGKDARCVVDLHSDVTELSNINGDKIELPTTTQPSIPADSLDRVNEVSQQLLTTVRLPLAQKILVGGMTLEPASKDEASRQLYLVIEADAVK
jgi:type II secretory pathway component GspD/PulD (secretin)